MILHIFKGSERVFAVTPDEAGSNLPSRHGPWERFKVMDMHPNEPQAGVDVNECLQDIDRYGMHLTRSHERITHLVLDGDH